MMAATRWTLEELLGPALARGEATCEHWLPQTPVGGLCTDSRRAGADDIFFARRGTRVDGLRFVDAALANGAVAVVTPADLEGSERVDYGVPTLRAHSLARTLGEAADRYFATPSRHLRVVAATGTNGKTSVTHFIADALASLGFGAGLLGTLGRGLAGRRLSHEGLTTPDVVDVHRALAEFTAAGAHYVALEASSHALDQERLAGVRIEVAVLTNLTRDHLDYHRTERAYARAKRRLFERPELRACVLNADDQFGADLIAELEASCFARIITYRLLDGPADTPHEAVGESTSQAPMPSAAPVAGTTVLVGHILEHSGRGMRLALATPGERGELSKALVGRFNAENLLAAAGALLALGIDFAQALEALSGVLAPAGRLERVELPGAPGCALPTVLVDYAHTPEALRSALQALAGVTSGRLWCVFGCGGDRDRGKRALMGAVAREYATEVVVTSDNPRGESPEAIARDILEAWGDGQAPRVELDRERAIALAIAQAHPEDLILIAGKGHETYQIIAGRSIDFDDREVAARHLGGRRRC